MTISYFEFSLDAAVLNFQLNKFNMYTVAHTFVQSQGWAKQLHLSPPT